MVAGPAFARAAIFWFDEGLAVDAGLRKDASALQGF